MEVVRDHLGGRPVRRRGGRRRSRSRDRRAARRPEAHARRRAPSGRCSRAPPSGPRQRRWNSASPTESTSSTKQDLRLEMRRDGEREPHVHAARVALDGRVDEPLHARELDDVVEPLLDLATLHPEDRAVQVDVLAAGELLVEAGSDLEQAPDAAADLGAALGRERDPREDLEQRRLARAVASDDAQDLALGHLERDVAKRPDLGGRAMVLLAGNPSPGVDERLPERPVGRLVLAETVLLGERVDFDRDRHQIVSAKPGSEERKVASPTTNSTQATVTPTATWPMFGWRGVEHGPAPAGDHGGHRVERQDPLPLRRDLVDREHHAREQSGSTWRKTGIM